MCVDLVVECEDWRTALPDLDAVISQGASLATAAWSEVDPKPASEDWEICVLACDDARIAALNADHRGKPSPTNVLSWPAFELSAEVPGNRPAAPPSVGPGPGPLHLGDVAIALQTVIREADAAQRPLKNHVVHLILHGCLHLLGYDHETAEDAELMEGIERRAMMDAGYDDPYA